jgi:hypothetical protein
MSAGCGRPSAGSCSVVSSGAVVQCIEFHEGYTSDQIQAACPNSANESYSGGSCASDNRFGQCEVSLSVGGITLAETLVYYPPLTPTQAMQDCTDHSSDGGFTATYSAN